MTERFADRVARLASKVDCAEAVKQSLNQVLGESAASSTIYYLGGAKALREPKIFEEKLRVMFGMGAEIIMKHILKNLETPSKTTHMDMAEACGFNHDSKCRRGMHSQSTLNRFKHRVGVQGLERVLKAGAAKGRWVAVDSSAVLEPKINRRNFQLHDNNTLSFFFSQFG